MGLKFSSRQNVYITFDNEGDALVEYKRGQSVDWDMIEQVLRPLRNAELGFSSVDGGSQRKRPPSDDIYAHAVGVATVAFAHPHYFALCTKAQ